jgi:hypothetical protein
VCIIEFFEQMSRYPWRFAGCEWVTEHL